MKDWFYISIFNPFKTMKKLKGVFKPLTCYYTWGKNSWRPFVWGSKPAKIQIISRDIGWKDKYDTPRFEEPPYIWIRLFEYDFIWYWSLLPHFRYSEEFQYWEQALWYLHYYNNISYKSATDSEFQNGPNIEKAKKSWPWADLNNVSTWSDKYLVK